MAFSSSTSGLSATPNVTPLIDVLLVLLIIFMVITPSVSQGLASQLPIPSAASASVTQAPVTVTVKVLRGPAGVSYHLEGEEFTAGELVPGLQQVLAVSRTSRVVWVSGDPGVDYHDVVVAIAAAKQAGFYDVALLPRSRGGQAE